MIYLCKYILFLKQNNFYAEIISENILEINRNLYYYIYSVIHYFQINS